VRPSQPKNNGPIDTSRRQTTRENAKADAMAAPGFLHVDELVEETESSKQIKWRLEENKI
jgi:hypothetical protein